MISAETFQFTLVVVSAVTAAWLATYLIHSTAAVALAWVCSRAARVTSHTEEWLWKVALFGGVITATVAIVAGVHPIAGRYATGGAVERVIWSSVASATDLGVITRGRTAIRFLPVLIVLAWLCYAVYIMARVVSATKRARAALGARTDVTQDERVVFDTTAKRLGLQHTVRLSASEQIGSPVALGASEITVPRRMLSEFTTAEQEGVLAHEIAHLLRRDPMWLLMAATIETLFFFQPLNRVARRKWQEQAEYLCDETAVRAQGTGVPLARSLARVAEWIQASDRQLLAPALAEMQSTLLPRVRRLLSDTPVVTASSGRARMRNTTARIVAALAIIGVVLVICPAFTSGPLRSWGTPAFHWSGVVAEGSTVSLQGVMGSIRLEQATGDSMIVEASRHGRRTNPDVHFDVVRTASGVAVCALYPVPNGVPLNTCTLEGAGQYNTKANDTEVEFLVRVPRHVLIQASSSTGDVTSGVLHNSVTAQSASGDIDLRFGTLNAGDTIDAGSASGNINIRLPAAVRAQLIARTHVGRVRTDFPLVDSGGAVLRMTTTAGNITVKRSKK